MSLFAHIERNTAHRVTPSTVSFGFHSIWNKVLFPHQNVINECLLCTQPHIRGPWSYHLDFVYTLYQIIYLCHQARLSWGSVATLCHDNVCSLYLFVIAFSVTLGHCGIVGWLNLKKKIFFFFFAKITTYTYG